MGERSVVGGNKERNASGGTSVVAGGDKGFSSE